MKKWNGIVIKGPFQPLNTHVSIFYKQRIIFLKPEHVVGSAKVINIDCKILASSSIWVKLTVLFLDPTKAWFLAAGFYFYSYLK